MEGLQIVPGSFSEAMALQRAIASALREARYAFSSDILDGGDIDADSIDSIIKMILSVGVSKEIEDCLFSCSARAVFKGEKVDRDFFEIVENRELYYPVMLEVAKVNVSPFFSKIGSGFSGVLERVKGIRKSK